MAQGVFDTPDHFTADQVLAKHDEKYMPPEVAMSEALKKQGRWKEGEGGAPVPRAARRIPELGHFALLLATGLALYQAIALAISARRAMLRR